MQHHTVTFLVFCFLSSVAGYCVDTDLTNTNRTLTFDGTTYSGSFSTAGCWTYKFVYAAGSTMDLQFNFVNSTGLGNVYVSAGKANSALWYLFVNGSSTVPTCSLIGGNTYYVAMEAAFNPGTATLNLNAVQVAPTAIPLLPTTTAINGTLNNQQYVLYKLAASQTAQSLSLSQFVFTHSDATPSNTYDLAIYVNHGSCPDFINRQESFSVYNGGVPSSYLTNNPQEAIYVLIANSNSYNKYSVSFTGTTKVGPVKCAPYNGNTCSTSYPTAQLDPAVMSNKDTSASFISIFCGFFPSRRAHNVICGSAFPKCDANNFPTPLCPADCDALRQDCTAITSCNSTAVNCYPYANGASSLGVSVVFFAILVVSALFI